MLTRVPHSGGVACEAKRCDVTRQSYRKAVTFVYAPMRTTVLQKGSDFRLCSNAHVHPADQKLPLRAKSSTIVKQRIKEQPHARAMDIVADVMSDITNDERFLAPKQKLMKRTANKFH
ncbi:uncharacterized protein LOC127848118 [Dreissena polymorpha]|uniref:uncharacterized protein LOC127848118 n=1 Tax=Dreissena polymorpha TaxID=45954 RepID=UPI002263CB96|nr:uncharacterized protein LOC127848118 [Dreissena polymorpha]